RGEARTERCSARVCSSSFSSAVRVAAVSRLESAGSFSAVSMTARTSPTAATSPRGIKMRASLPVTGASISNTAFSVCTSTRTSPWLIQSPSDRCQNTMRLSCTSSEVWGSRTSTCFANGIPPLLLLFHQFHHGIENRLGTGNDPLFEVPAVRDRHVGNSQTANRCLQVVHGFFSGQGRYFGGYTVRAVIFVDDNQSMRFTDRLKDRLPVQGNQGAKVDHFCFDSLFRQPIRRLQGIVGHHLERNDGHILARSNHLGFTEGNRIGRFGDGTDGGVDWVHPAQSL